MKRRFCSWILVLAIVLGLFPAAVCAAEGDAIPFSAKTGETVLPVEKSREDHTYTVVTEYDENWNPVKTEERTVDLYVVDVPDDAESVTLTFGTELLAYLYDKNGNYSASCGQYGDGTTGQTTASVPNLNGFVRVQTPYDSAWNSEFLYAVAFDYLYQSPEQPSEEVVSIGALLSNIAAGYTENSGEWIMMDMAAYEDTIPDSIYNTVPDSVYRTTPDTKQTYIDSTIATLTKESVSEAAYAKAILILQSIGVDPQELYPENSAVPISAVDGLKALETYSTSAWVAPYTLIALNQGEYGTDALEQRIISAVLANQGADGSWSEWGDSIQTTSNMIAGLAFYYHNNETVKVAIDKAVAFLSAAQKEDGTFDAYGYGSDANTAAMVVIALSALGIDPDTDERFVKNGNSALDGLLSFALNDNSAFGYTDNTAANAYSTEQGFRALIAACEMMQSHAPYNIYDFSANEVVPGTASEGGEGSNPGGSTPAPDADLSVTFTMKTHQTTWISNLRVGLEDGATVSDLLYEVAAQDDRLSFEDEGGYISSVTYDGETWAEFDAGLNSGWKYTVNGAAPVVGMNDRVLEDGDKVVWYYVIDFKQDSTKNEESAEPEEPIEEDVSLPFTDTQDHWAHKAIAYCYSRGIMAGTGETTFAPDMTTSRGMIVTILYNLEGRPTISGDRPFADVNADAYYADAAKWAEQEGIVSGYGNGFFGPEDMITREQMAMILMNYARYKGYDTQNLNDLDAYADADQIHNWALEAVRWANAEGMICGRSADALAPLESSTRGESAAILMQFLENNEA